MNIEQNQHGTFISGNLTQDTTLVGSDTIIKQGNNNAFVFAFDTAYQHVHSFIGTNTVDQFINAQLLGDTLAVGGQFINWSNNPLTFDTITYSASANEHQVGGLFLFDALTHQLLGLYPSSSSGSNSTVNVAAASISQHSFGIGGSFIHSMSFAPGATPIVAVSNCTNCTNSDLFFALFDRNGSLMAQEVIYTSGTIGSSVFTMAHRDSMLYIGGIVSDSVIIPMVDTFITKNSNDAFLAAYNLNSTTSLAENTAFVKANNGLLAYPNPSRGRFSIMGKPLSNRAQLYNLKGQMLQEIKLDVNQFNQAIEIKKVPPGIYFMVVQGEKERQQIKMVITNY
jgi:hypothetical protein